MSLILYTSVIFEKEYCYFSSSTDIEKFLFMQKKVYIWMQAFYNAAIIFGEFPDGGANANFNSRRNVPE